MATLAAGLLTVAAAQLLDLATFSEMVRRVGPAAEANPLVGTLFGAYGLPTVAAAKIALIALVSAIVVVLARRPARRTTATVLGCAIAAGLVGGLSNAVALGVV